MVSDKLPEGIRLVNLDNVAVTAVCDICGQQYDHILLMSYYKFAGADAVFQSAFNESLCNICYGIQYGFDDDQVEITCIDQAVAMVEAYNDDLARYIEDHIKDLQSRLDRLVRQQADMTAPRHIPASGDVIQRLDRLEDLMIRLLTAPRAPADSAPRLGQSDVDLLHALALRHTGRDVADLLNHLKLGSLLEFRDKYVTLDDAMKAIASRIVDSSTPILSYVAETRSARNNALYLSVNFGFNNCSVFNGAVDALFRDTDAYIALTGIPGWRTDGFSCEFRTPVEIVMEREPSGYPRILNLKEVR